MKKSIIFFTIAVLFFACKTEKIPVAEFAPYIAAYTGGLVQADDVIRIELTEPSEAYRADGEAKNLFKFSPSISGKAYWANDRTLEFVPEAGALKNGTAYTATFRLGKVNPKVEKRLKNFVFDFRVQDRSFYFSFLPFEMTDSKMVNVSGQIVFSDNVKLEDVQKAVSAKISSGQMLAPAVEMMDSKTFLVSIKNIERKKEDLQLELTINGKVAGIERSDIQLLSIPALDVFKVYSVQAVQDAETRLDIVFSQPLAEQNLKGLISIPELKNFTTEQINNKITVYFEPAGILTLTVTVHKQIQNLAGENLEEDFVRTLTLESLKPQIKLVRAGNILPDAANLKIPFKAVNLRAVDVRVIQIYENNILQFLQENDLDGSSELRRVGRLVYKKTLLLSQPAGKYALWQNYSLDLSKLVNRQQGAIYRVEMSFKKDYSTYPDCGDNEAIAGEKNVSQSLGNDNGISESEEKFWDEPYSYYYSNPNYNWSEYDWDERKNPCHSSYYMTDEAIVTCNVMTSNIGVIAKQNSDSKIWISTADILTTKALSGVEVTAYSYQLQEIGKAATDGEGFAVIQAKGKAFVLVAKQGMQKTYLKLADGSENSLSRFDIEGKKIEKGLKGFIYGERGVWRPGDTLHVSFILYDAEKKIPENHPVTLEIYNVEGQFYTKQISTKGINGFYVFHIPTNQDDGTGLWNAYVKVGGVTFHKSLRIETIKPNRLKINLDLGSEKYIDANKKVISANLTSAWLTGAKAHNMQAKVEMTLKRVKTQFKGYEAYVFNSPASDFENSTTEIFSGKTNENGSAHFTFGIPQMQNAPGMLSASIVARVFEAGGDASIFTQDLPFSPYESYVGLKTNIDADKYIETGKNHSFDIVTLSPDGKPVSRNDIEYKIYKMSWSWWWENDSENFSRYVNSTSYRPVIQGIAKTENGKGSFSAKLPYPEWGRFLVLVKDTKSGHSAGSVVWIDYYGNESHNDSENPNSVKMLSFSLNKKSYEVGENAVVSIPAAAGGTALVSFENGSQVLSRTWLTIEKSGETKYNFTVTKEMSPNCYIHISLLQPHNQTVNELPIRMYGVQPLTVTDKNSKLEPQITVAEVIRPETEFTVKVSEKSGKSMTYTLAIVDDGLLDLTNFKTPNPAAEFFAREALGIRTWDMYDNVIGAFGGRFGSMLSIGGDEELKGVPKANRFNPVVKFVGAFALGSGKINTHKVRLPQYVGSVRVMLVAGQDGAFGNAEKTVSVRSPLMLLSSLPRVLSVNEEISLPVNVFTMEDDVKNVSVTVKTENGLVQVLDKSKSLTFSTPSDQIVYFRIKTSDKTGIEKFTITANGNGKTATENIEIDVRNPNPPIVTSENKILQAGENAEFAYAMGDASPENWLRLEVARIPSVDISRRMDFLYYYEHYCSEQITSCALPMLYIPLFKDLNGNENNTLKTNILQAISKLYTRQASNGGFLYWDSSREPDEWITSYVGLFLVEAKAKSYNVNEGVINRWKTYQQKFARGFTPNTANEYYRAASEYTQAFRLYTLALAGASELGAMNRLKESKALSAQARWMLAAAYAVDGKTQAAEELIFNQPTTVAKYSNRYIYGDNLRDEALILLTLTQMNRLDAAFKQAQHISQQLSAEKYFCTQSTAYALMAMSSLAEKSSGATIYDWTLNGRVQKVENTKKAVVQTELPVSQLKGKVSLTNKGTGILYAALVSKTVPLVDTLPEIADNLRLTVYYHDLQGNSLNVEKLAQGTDFIAVIKVANNSTINDYDNLALTHIIPAGWEVASSELQTSSGATYRDIRDDRVLTYFDLARGKTVEFSVRLQATYIGKFTLPAVRCQAMYNPEAQARTRAGKVEVAGE